MDSKTSLHLADSKEKLLEFDQNSFHSCVCDPPYELGIMNKSWDESGIAFDKEYWSRVYNVLKPGAHLLAFGGNRTHHRLMVAIEDAGFEIRDCIMWLYSNGMISSHNVSKAIDKHHGKSEDREVVDTYTKTESYTKEYSGESRDETPWGQAVIEVTAPATEDAKKWQGCGTKLKPAYEPIVLARKPLSEKNIAKNVLKHSAGAINIGDCKIGNEKLPAVDRGNSKNTDFQSGGDTPEREGRWPTNFMIDDEVAGELDWQSRDRNASRFFYSPKAQQDERNIGTVKNNHSTVKPIELMAYLVRLVTPPEGEVLDPFMGSGSTGVAAVLENVDFTGIELREESFEIAEDRIQHTKENYLKVRDLIFDDPHNEETNKEKSSMNHGFW